MDFSEITRLIGAPGDEALRSLAVGPFAVLELDFAEPDQAIYLLARDRGIELAVDDDRTVSTIWLHSGRRDGHARYTSGPLPAGLSFNSTQAEVRGALETPAASAERFVSEYLGKQGPWDRWSRRTHLLHVQYVYEGEGIDLITIMPAEWKPGGEQKPSRRRHWWQVWRNA